MGRAVFTIIGAAVLVLAQRPAFAAGAIVFDATNAARFGSMVAEAQKQVSELKGLSTKLESLNGRLGGVLPSASVERLSALNATAQTWGHYLHALSSPEAAAQSLTSTLGYRNAPALRDLQGFVLSKFYAPAQHPVSYESIEAIQRSRLQALAHSSVMGVALSSQKKHSLTASQQKIAEISMEALRAPTLHDDLIASNKLLAMIAQELTQHRELLSQQLELMSALAANGAPISPTTVRTP